MDACKPNPIGFEAIEVNVKNQFSNFYIKPSITDFQVL